MNAKWNTLRPALLSITRRRDVRIGTAALVVYALLGFLLLPYAVEQYLPKYACETLQRQASIGAVRVNPFLFKVEADDFRLQEQDGRPLVAFRHLLVDFELASLFRWAWTFKDIRLEGLDLLIDKDPEGRINLAALAESFPKSEEPPAADDDKPARLLLQHVALIDGALTYSDRSVSKPASTTLKPVTLELHNLATLPERSGSYALSFELTSGGSVYHQGSISLQPFAAEGDVSVQGVRPEAYWGFLSDQLRLAEPQGTLVFQMHYRYGLDRDVPRLNLQAMQLHVAGLDVREPDAQMPLLALEALEVKDGQFDLGSRTLSLPQITLRNGRVSAALARDGSVNWQRLAVAGGTPAASVPEPQAPAAEPWHIQAHATRLENIAVRFDDRSRATPLSVDVGRLGASARTDITIGKDTAVTVDAIAVQLARLALGQAGAAEPLATLGEARLDGGSVDTGKREARITQVMLRDGQTRIDRDAQGQARLLTAFAGAGDGAAAKGAAAASGGPAWRFKLDTLKLDGYRVGFSDQSLQPALAYDLEGIAVTLKDLSNAAQTPVNFEAALRVAQGGTLSANGSFAADGSTAKAQVKLDQVALAPLRSLLARHALLDLKAGTASTVLDLDYAAGDTAPVLRATGTANIADLLINEEIGGDRFVAWKTLTAEGIDYASAPGKLAIKEMRLTAPSAKVQIFKDRSVNLGKVFEKGTKSKATPAPESAGAEPGVETAKPPPAAVKPAPAAEKQDMAERTFPITVGRVRVEKGIVDYSDQSLVLPFAAKIRDFHGAVTGIASDPKSRAKLNFEGRVEQYGSAKVSGSLAPFAPKHFTDIRTEFRNIDMPPFSPYSATFAGRKIASGKLSLDLEYKIDDGALAGDNKILLEKFTLGEPIESPDALDLPLDLAVALLTDSQGRIDVAVPVTGDMNSPKFSLGGVIGQAVVRMLTKIVTAPFAALGNLLGGSGEQANAIAFEPGSAQLSPPQQEKLVNVGKALAERPQLKVVVGGRYDPESDGEALRSERVRRELAAELDVKLAPEEDPGPVAFDDAHTQRALEKLLETRAGDKAVDEFQAQYEKQSGQPVKRVNPVLALVGQESPDHAFYEALFKHLVEIHPLEDADLQTLAQRRAEIVAQSLVTDAGVDQQRVEVGKVEVAGGTKDGMVESVLALDVRQP